MDENKRLFEMIYNETKEHVYRFIAAGCYRLDDIDDIYQNTYVSIYNSIRKGRQIEDPEAFAVHAAKHELHRYYGLMKRLGSRLRSSLPSGSSDASEMGDAETYVIEDRVADKALAAEIAALLAKKNITTQKVFFLYYYRDMTLSEISKTLGISKSRVKRRLYSTLEQLRRLYGKE